jgi:hypothetical protein
MIIRRKIVELNYQNDTKMKEGKQDKTYIPKAVNYDRLLGVGLSNSLPIVNHNIMEEMYRKFMRDEQNTLTEILTKYLGREPLFEDFSRLTKTEIPHHAGSYFLEYNRKQFASVSRIYKAENGTIIVRWVYELL